MNLINQHSLAQRGAIARRAVLVILGLLTLSSAPLHAASPFPVINICHETADIHPWSDRQGGGLNFTLLAQTAQALGLRFEYEIVPWKRCLAMLQANQVDGAFAASFKPDRLEFGVYPGNDTSSPDASKRLHIDRYVLVRRKGDKLDWDGKQIRNLQGAVGAQLGYSIVDQLKAMGVEVEEGGQSALIVLRKLALKRLGGAALLTGEANAVLTAEPALAEQLEVLPTPLVEKPYYLMLSHGLVTKQPERAKAIWATIERLRNSPTYQAAERKAFSGSGSK